MISPISKKLRSFLFSNWRGCTNNNCVVLGETAGMHTNGMCKCLPDASRSQLGTLGSRLQALLPKVEKQPEGNELWKFDLLRLTSKYDMSGALIWSGEDLEFGIICNDVFHWGCADVEDVHEEDLPMLEQAFKDSDIYGDDLYCARKRGMRPQGAMYKHIDKEAWHLFDACGPERDPKEPGNTPKPTE